MTNRRNMVAIITKFGPKVYPAYIARGDDDLVMVYLPSDTDKDDILWGPTRNNLVNLGVAKDGLHLQFGTFTIQD